MSGRIFLIVLLIGILYSIPTIIEIYLKNTLDFKAIRTEFQQAFHEETGLTLRTEGVRFSIFYGIIFTGVELDAPPGQHGTGKTDPSHRTILKTENMVLGLSFRSLITGEFPYRKLILHEGVFNPYALSYEEWIQLFQKLNVNNPPPGETASDGITVQKVNLSDSFQKIDFVRTLQLEIRDMLIQFPESIHQHQITKKYPDVYLNLDVRSGKKGFSAKFEVRTKLERGKGGILSGRGEWLEEKDLDRKLYFEYKSIPAPLLYSIVVNLELFPSHFPTPHLVMESGLINGTGSAHIHSAGLALDLKGGYQDLALREASDIAPTFILTPSRGDFSYNAGFYPESSKPAFVEFSIKQNNLSLAVDFRDILSEGPEKHYLKINGSTTFIPDDQRKDATGLLHIPNLNLTGPLTFHIFMDHSSLNEGDRIYPDIRIKMDGLAFRLPENREIPDANSKPRNALTIDSGMVTIDKTGAGKMNLSGNFMDGEYRLDADGEIKFHIQKGHYGQNLIIQRKINAEFLSDNNSYQELALYIQRVVRNIYLQGIEKNARLTEDQGPIWYNKFLETDFFQKFIKPCDLSIHFLFRNLTGRGGNLPEELEFQLRKKDYFFKSELLTNSSAIKYKHTATFETALPIHDITFHMDVNHNEIAFPEILGHNKPPESFQFRLNYNGQGVIAGDLVSRSYSYLTFTANHVDLSRTQTGRIAELALGLGEKELTADTFRFQRSTEGAISKTMGIRFINESLDARGDAFFDPGKGGQIHFAYYFTDKERKSQNGKLKIRIDENGRRLPDM